MTAARERRFDQIVRHRLPNRQGDASGVPRGEG